MDRLELWEVAAILGANEPDEKDPARPGAPPARPAGRRPETGAERARRLERERPEWMDEPLTPGEQAILQASGVNA